MLQAFLASRRQNAAVIGINAALIQLPTSVSINVGGSAYGASKIAQAKLLEHVATENPDLFVASVHPGVVQSDMLAQFDVNEGDVPIDDGKNRILPHAVAFVYSHSLAEDSLLQPNYYFCCTSPFAALLSGRASIAPTLSYLCSRRGIGTLTLE